MHEYYDDWFALHGDELYDAISELKAGFKKHRLHIYVSEKNGCVRDEVVNLWNGGLFQLLFGYGLNVDTDSEKGLLKYKPIRNLWNRFRRFVNFKIDAGTPSQKEGEPFSEYAKRYEKRLWKGLVHINSRIGLTKFVNGRQAAKINRVFQEVCARHKDIVDELICDLNCYPCIKPCKWGDIDGEKIHRKYWREI